MFTFILVVNLSVLCFISIDEAVLWHFECCSGWEKCIFHYFRIILEGSKEDKLFRSRMVGVVGVKEEECLLSEGETFSPTVIGGCGMCGQSFTDKSHLEEHIQNHKKVNVQLHEPEEDEDDDIDQSKDAISDFISPYIEEEETA